MFFRRRHTKRNIELDPSDVLLDGSNIPDFDNQQFEGVIEHPIKRSSLYWVGALCLVVFIVFISRLGALQIVHGSSYFEQSEENRLHRIPIFSERGVIEDRNGEPLAWNALPTEEEPFSRRAYSSEPGFGHILGYVKYPQKDNNGFFWRTALEGVSGIEERLNDTLQGENGTKLVETDARFNIQSENVVNPAKDGENVRLTIDAGVQTAFHQAIKQMTEEFNYEGGGGVIMNVHTGEVLALTNYPEIDSAILSEGSDRDEINEYFTSDTTPFLNRVVSGLYTPGSIVKPFIALGALQEGIITDRTIIYSNGYIEVPNPYNPDQVSTFGDWREEGHGPTNVYHAIADSVNTFFYAISGGYRNQEGMGITKMAQYLEAFDIAGKTGIDLEGEVSGIIPTPDWKEKVFDDAWRLGDTYITSIGQFGFQVTPLQMARATSGIASGGFLVEPHVIQREFRNSGVPVSKLIDDEYYSIVQEGMRQTVTEGTAYRLNVPYVDVAAKTGTAQVGLSRSQTNSWTIGFFPYENPQYAFAIVMEKGPTEDAVGSNWAIRDVLDWMSENRPEYLE